MRLHRHLRLAAIAVVLVLSSGCYVRVVGPPLLIPVPVPVGGYYGGYHGHGYYR